MTKERDTLPNTSKRNISVSCRSALLAKAKKKFTLCSCQSPTFDVSRDGLGFWSKRNVGRFMTTLQTQTQFRFRSASHDALNYAKIGADVMTGPSQQFTDWNKFIDWFRLAQFVTVKQSSINGSVFSDRYWKVPFSANGTSFYIYDHEKLVFTNVGEYLLFSENPILSSVLQKTLITGHTQAPVPSFIFLFQFFPPMSILNINRNHSTVPGPTLNPSCRRIHADSRLSSQLLVYVQYMYLKLSCLVR
jgi:hypothetical protein